MKKLQKDINKSIDEINQQTGLDLPGVELKPLYKKGPDLEGVLMWFLIIVGGLMIGLSLLKK